MKIDFIRLFLRIVFLGFMLGRFKKKELRGGRSRGFVNVVCPLPANKWVKENDFLWEPNGLISKEIKEEDWVIFFGYHTPSGWRAKWVIKIF